MSLTRFFSFLIAYAMFNIQYLFCLSEANQNEPTGASILYIKIITQFVGIFVLKKLIFLFVCILYSLNSNISYL